jgi:hypothetical protein
MKKSLFLRKNMLFLILAAMVCPAQLSHAQSVKGVLNPPSPAEEVRFRNKEKYLLKTISQIGQGKNLDQIEKIILQLKDDPDLVLTYGMTKISRFDHYDYFALAQCQEKQGKKKLALDNYRMMYSKWIPKFEERGMGFYALCALDNGYFNEARVVTQECIDAMRENPIYGKEYEYITDVTVTSDTNVIRAHIYLLLSRVICNGNSTIGEKDDGGVKAQEYLKKAIELGRGTTPNAYLRMAQYMRWSDPVQSRKYLEDLAKMYKKYPMHAEEARKRLKEYPPETEKTKE